VRHIFIVVFAINYSWRKSYFCFWKPGLVDPATALTLQKYNDSIPGRSGLPAHFSTRLKGAPSSFRATGDAILSAPHAAASALLHFRNGSSLIVRNKSRFAYAASNFSDEQYAREQK